jgi:hypothetical protein
MKHVFAVLLILLPFLLLAQQPDYSAGTQKLVPEASYLSQADWESMFYDPDQKDIATRVGIKKRVIIAPDESVFINDRYKYRVMKFNIQGKFVKTFGKKGYKPGEFINNPDLHGILDGRYVVVSDAQGRINFFDLDGNIVKMITIDFMPLKIFPLKNGKLIIQGHVPYGTKSKKLLAELDYQTETYTQIYYTFEDYDDPKGGIFIEYKGGLIGFGRPFGNNKNFCRVTENGRIILASNSTEQILVFTRTGGSWSRSDFNIELSPIPISQEEKNEYFENFKERLKKLDIDTAEAEQILQNGYFPETLPYYYNLIADESGNILLFIYSNDDRYHLFRAYTSDGKFLGESEFTIEGYELLSGLGHFTFMNGFVYTLALKKEEESPLRILKCRIVSGDI